MQAKIIFPPSIQSHPTKMRISMSIMLGILEIAQKHYFNQVECEHEKEAAKKAIRKKQLNCKIFFQNGRKFLSKIFFQIRVDQTNLVEEVL